MQTSKDYFYFPNEKVNLQMALLHEAQGFNTYYNLANLHGVDGAEKASLKRVKSIAVKNKIRQLRLEHELHEGKELTNMRRSLKELKKEKKETKKMEKEKIINISKIKMLIQSKRNNRSQSHCRNEYRDKEVSVKNRQTSVCYEGNDVSSNIPILTTQNDYYPQNNSKKDSNRKLTNLLRNSTKLLPPQNCALNAESNFFEITPEELAQSRSQAKTPIIKTRQHIKNSYGLNLKAFGNRK